MIVAGTSLIAYLLLSGPRASAARAVYAKDSEWVAPCLWQSEFRNVLVQHIRHAGLTRALADEAWEAARALMTEREAPSDSVLDVALAESLSAYDAEFAALAAHLGLPLVTDDRRLLAAITHAISLDDFVA